MGPEVNEDNILKLVEKHGQELTTDELVDLHCMQQQEHIDGILSEEQRREMRGNPSLQMRLEECVKCVGSQAKF